MDIRQIANGLAKHAQSAGLALIRRARFCLAPFHVAVNDASENRSMTTERETALAILDRWLAEEPTTEHIREFKALQEYLYAPYYCPRCDCPNCGNTKPAVRR